jgi:hypothetical protein
MATLLAILRGELRTNESVPIAPEFVIDGGQIDPKPLGQLGVLSFLGQLDELLADAERRSMKVFALGD